MAGIYIHIPFCKQACHYCNFHFSTSLDLKNEFMQALLAEIKLRKNELQQEGVKTIYFGGGTPGILHAHEIKDIVDCIHEHFDCAALEELTIEMNPDDVTAKKLLSYKELGIDRVSLGVQSFFEEDLNYMNRSHNAPKALASIELIAAHFKNFSVDLIYGYPLLTDEKLKQNIDTLLQFDPPHISIYGMTVEPKTALASFIKKGKEQDMDLEKQAKQYAYIMERLDGEVFEHYEISSFAKKDFRAKHNTSYWRGEKYLGFGPGAHSFDGIKKRQWNIANNALYIKSLGQGILHAESEELSAMDIANEYVMTSLRRKEGLDFDQYQSLCSTRLLDRLKLRALPYINKDWLAVDDKGIRLTPKGKLMCDGVSADLFID